MDRILRLLALSWIHTMRMDRLRTCGTPQDPSDWIKASVMWTSFGRFFSSFQESVQAIFSGNGKDVKVFLVYRDLK